MLNRLIKKIIGVASQTTSELETQASSIQEHDSLKNLYEQYRAEASSKIARGKSGELRLVPKSIWLNISDNCNLRCIGCHSEGKFKKIYADIEEVRKSIQFSGQIEQISFTTNEALLHPQFCDIIDMCREMHPEAKLWVITNGTIPIKGRYKNAIAKLDKVGLSIDGATKDTFESIRIGARFENFLENAKEIIKIRNETGSPKEITFGFTATATNLHELIDVVRLAHNLGASDVWAQSMEAKDETIKARISGILIDNLDPSLRTRFIDEAKAEAARLGIGFYYSEGIYPTQANVHNEQTDSSENHASKELHLKLCQYPWEQPVQISKLGKNYVVRPCCYISTTKTNVLAQKYGLSYQEIQSGDDVYNSPQLWQFREDLLNGKTMDVCGACDAARGFQWKPAPAENTKSET